MSDISEIAFKIFYLLSNIPKVLEFESLFLVIRRLADSLFRFVAGSILIRLIYTNATASSKLSKNAAARKRLLYKKGQ